VTTRAPMRMGEARRERADAPYVVTLALDEESQQGFDALRRRFLPSDRLHVGAHLTLFDAIPAVAGPPVLSDCLAVAASPPFPVRSVRVRNLGQGVAIELQADPLRILHARLSHRWHEWLTARDRAPLRPHVAVQSRVSTQTARETTAALTADFAPSESLACGINLWRYRKGPWELIRSFSFVG
jgi:hypothetical protein